MKFFVPAVALMLACPYPGQSSTTANRTDDTSFDRGKRKRASKKQRRKRVRRARSGKMIAVITPSRGPRSTDRGWTEWERSQRRSPTPAPSAGGDVGVTSFEVQALQLVNRHRAEGAYCGGEYHPPAPPLRFEARLQRAADLHSLDMYRRGYFAHQNLSGQSPFDRMQAQGYPLAAGGENIAAGQRSPAQVVQGWMDSPGHCRNAMNPSFTETGLGHVEVRDGNFGHYWTQKFGSRSRG